MTVMTAWSLAGAATGSADETVDDLGDAADHGVGRGTHHGSSSPPAAEAPPTR